MGPAASCDEWPALQWSVCFSKPRAHVSVGAGLGLGLGPRVDSRLGLRLGLGYYPGITSTLYIGMHVWQAAFVADGRLFDGLFGSQRLARTHLWVSAEIALVIESELPVPLDR